MLCCYAPKTVLTPTKKTVANPVETVAMVNHVNTNTLLSNI